MNADAPFSAGELSAERLTQALKACGSLSSDEVSSFEAEPIGGGTGFLSPLVRIHVTESQLSRHAVAINAEYAAARDYRQGDPGR
jgi:hypothetical protein